jgi:transcriptional regulator with XRE-family HTH domain
MTSLLFELGSAVKARRTDMGLTQTALAKASGLSRATVNQVENNTLKDLSINRAGRLLGTLGLSLTAPTAHARQAMAPKSSALAIAARTASVSYRLALPPRTLRRCVEAAKLPAGFEPHLSALLEEAPVSLLARLVEELHAQSGIEHALLWQNMRHMARGLQSQRDIWQ